MQSTFTDTEMALLLQAPMQAIAAITLADKVDPVMFLKEVQAGISILANELQRQDIPGNLVQDIINHLREIDAKDALSGEQLQLKKGFELLNYLQSLKNAATGQEIAISHFLKVSNLLAEKTTGAEAKTYKEWLIAFAQKVAEAFREGSLLGIVGSRISERESAILTKLAHALEIEKVLG